MLYCGYVVQELIPPASIYGESVVPRTVVVLERDFLKILTSFSFQQIIDESKKAVVVEPSYGTVFWGIVNDNDGRVLPNYPHFLDPKDYQDLVRKGDIPSLDCHSWGLEIPPALVKHWGLRMGDKIRFGIKDGILVIFDVNGISDPLVVRSRPYWEELMVTYPQEILPLDKFGSLAWRMLYLLGAPQGKGQVTYIQGKGGLGKTTILRDAWKALLNLTQEDPGLFVVLTFIGERAEDLSDYLRDLEEISHRNDRVEVLCASKGVPPEFQWQMAVFAYYRANILALRHDLVNIIDSAPRLVDAYRAVADYNEGLVSGGIPVSAISKVAKMVGLGGYCSQTGTSKTIFVSTLDGDRQGDPLVVFTQLTADNNTTSRVVLTEAAEGFPKISVISGQCFTRWFNRFSPEGLLKEQDHVRQKTLDGSSSRVLPPPVVYNILRSYCEQNPCPNYY